MQAPDEDSTPTRLRLTSWTTLTPPAPPPIAAGDTDTGVRINLCDVQFRVVFRPDLEPAFRVSRDNRTIALNPSDAPSSRLENLFRAAATLKILECGLPSERQEAAAWIGALAVTLSRSLAEMGGEGRLIHI